MKKLILALFIFGAFFSYGQKHAPSSADSLEGFSMKEMLHHLEHFKGTEKEKQLRIQRSKRAFIDRKYKLGVYAPPIINQKGASPTPQTFDCTNVDFESGNTSGWTVTGDNAMMSSGTDAFGGFNKVFAGNYSLMLSSNNTSTSNFQSSAQRVLAVPSTGQTFFKFHFALDILDYPHTQNDAAKFYVNFYDAAGNQLTCPQYECYYYQNSGGAGTSVGISSFQQTPGSPGVNLGGQTFPVTYCTWQTVAVDLSSYAGQNITCKIECDWCVYNYDWAYCYIDADCPSSTTPSLPTCGALPFNLCGPSGMDSYSWTAPPGNTPTTSTSSCINAAVPGTYTLNATLNSCNVVAYTFTYNVQSGPIPSFTTNATPCSGNVSFGSTSSPNGGPAITSYTWNWGDGSAGGSGVNSAHTYTSTGTNTVTLVISNGSCVDSISQTINIPDHPVPAFTTANVCSGMSVTYTSTSTASAGIASQTWHFGDNTNGTGTPVSHTFPTTGTYSTTLVVADNNGCIDSITHAVTVYPLPTITVNNGTICGGGVQSATLTANGANTYTWSPAATLSASTGSVVTGNPGGTTVYTIIGTDVNTCTATTTATISVGASAIITVNSPTICVGQQTATLTASGVVSYTWSPAATLSSNTGSTVTGTPATTTNYTVIGTDATGCKDTAMTSITVNSLPMPTATSNTPCVSQENLLLTCPLNGMNSYQWSGPNSYASSVQNPTITPVNVTATSAGVYTISVTDANSCTNSYTFNVTVNPLPVVTVNSPTVCENQTINFLASGGVSYSWSGPGSPPFSSTLANPQIPNATLADAGNYIVTVTDANGCVNGNVSVVTVYQLPTISVNSATICLGQQTATLTATGANTYVWSPATGLNSTTTSQVYGAPSSATVYTVTGTDIRGCTNTQTASISINQLPVVTASSIAPACAPLCPTVVVTSSPPASSYSCSYSNGQDGASGFNPPSNTFSISTCYNTAGSFPIKVTVTDINSCVSTANTIAVVYPIPIADFEYQPNPVSILDPEVSFFNQSVGQMSNYSWDLGDGDTSALTNPVHTYADTGTYYVTLIVTSVQGCVDTTIKPLVVKNDYALYVPNAFTPNGDGKNDVFSAVGNGVKTFKMNVFDRWGNSLFYSENINVGWNGTMQNKGGELLQQDVYVWKIDVTDYNYKSKSLHGTVTLIK